MSNFNRLYKKLSRMGIETRYSNHTYHLQKQNAQASILLPQDLKLEEKAVQQLLNFAAVQVPGHSGHVCKACATPDFHPGSIAPVGSVIATSPDLVIPAALGTDINCGMRLLSTGVLFEHAQKHQQQLERLLSAALLHDQRDIPIPGNAFAALFNEGVAAWLDHLLPLGMWQQVDFKRLHQELEATLGLEHIQAHSHYAPEALFSKRELIRPASLGTTGSGNHFVELQIVDQILDRHLAYQCGLRVGEVVVMIHSGSRDVGFYVGQRWMDRAKAAWPSGVKHPTSGLYGLTDTLANQYMLAMGVAARYAWANRMVLAEMVREAWRKVFADDQSQLVVDISHNIIMREHGMNIHRKGATPAHVNNLALIPGSMGDYSYVVSGLGNPDWLWSCSHGAGRAQRRQSMRAQTNTHATHENQLPSYCVTLNESRKLEEAPSAYKAIGSVIQAQEQAHMIRAGVRLRPWITFKA